MNIYYGVTTYEGDDDVSILEPKNDSKRSRHGNQVIQLQQIHIN